jgi:thioredoxin 1
MQEQSDRKFNKPLSYVSILGVAILVVSSAVYHFWPEVKGLWSTTQAAVSLNNNVSLTAISYTEDNPMAIIDGQIVHEKDIVGDVKVLKIHKDKVEFESPSRTWTQSMAPAKEAITSGMPLLLELGSPKCPPCRKMTPILDKMKDKYSRKFQIKCLDVWKNPDIGSRYGVKAIPTQIFYDDKGKELFRHTGFFSKKQILKTWKEFGYDF